MHMGNGAAPAEGASLGRRRHPANSVPDKTSRPLDEEDLRAVRHFKGDALTLRRTRFRLAMVNIFPLHCERHRPLDSVMSLYFKSPAEFARDGAVKGPTRKDSFS